MARLRKAVASIAVVVLTLLGVSLAAPATADPTFTISGQVSSLIGFPAGTAQVESGFYDGTAWQYTPSVDVAADGTFSIDETTGGGEYDLYFTVPDYSVPFLDSYYQTGVDEPDGSVTTEAGVINVPTLPVDVTGITVTLVAAGYISGTVTTGTPPVAVEGEHVEAIDQVTGDGFDAESLTDPAGAYSIKVPAGDAMEVGDDSFGDFYPQFYNGHDVDPAEFDPVTVEAGLTQPGINFHLDPIDGSIFVGLDVEINPPPMQPADNVTVRLTVLDDGGNSVQDSSTVIHDGFGFIIGSAPGDYEIEITNSEGKRFAIDAVTSDGDSDPFFEAGSCVADLGVIEQGELDEGAGGVIEFDLNPDLTICNAAPAIPTPPAHHHPFVFTGSTTTAVATPTPTPTPTETPSASPSASPSPSASSTPSPVVTSSTGGLPWWVWLLIIVVVILILAGIAFVLFRRR
jgi:hypothetical protein